MSRKDSKDTNPETTGDDIAIIGIGCRFPGASCLRDFWKVLVNGENHVVEIDDERWSQDIYYDKDPRTPGKTYAPRAGFIKNYAHFDFKMFGINEHEAALMDPQQRQVLECTYMALEDAGITRQQIAGQEVGVYIGCMNNDFTQMSNKHPYLVDNYSVTGTAVSVVSNRVSYIFDLRGPSMTIDTACSSSVVALHQAGLAMKAGDCSMAICGGVNLLLNGGVFVPLSKAQMLSPTGQCHTFSANADGYTRGEGCGIVIIKPLKQAMKDGDNIWGTIATGLNQDGHVAKPLTAPSGEQQAQLIQDVYSKHAIDTTSIDYIEAHGTGTKIGDPVEVNAFGHFFLKQQQSKRRYIGSVKTNIGHLESAAGVAGLIKVLLMMKHSTIVPSLHFDKPNEAIDFDRFQFVVPTEPVPWLPDQKVACLNSFGFGGANSHAIVKNSSNGQTKSTYSWTKPVVVCFSGSNHQTLKKSIEQFLSIEKRDYDVHALSYTSCVRREHFQCRQMFVVSDMLSLEDQLTDFMKTDSREEPKKGHLRPLFVFCGMGTAWKGMGIDLMEQNKGFQETMEAIDTSLKRFVGWSLTQRLREDDVSDPVLGPIAIFACQVALAHLWKSWGVMPAAVVGQSVGEVAAAHVAGILSLDEAVRVIYHRTNILSRATGGKMLLVKNMDPQKVEHHCDMYEGKISVGLYYSPNACTVSGDASAVDELKVKLSNIDRDIKLIDLQVTTAFHSHHMDSCKEQIDDALQNLKTQHPTVPFISTIDSNYTVEDLRATTYWSKNAREPVKFGAGIKAAIKENAHNVFIEIGPRPVLKAHIGDILQGTHQTAEIVTSMTTNSKYEDLLKSLGELHAWNCNICWDQLCEMCGHTTPEPTHAFEHKHVMAIPNETEGSAHGASLSMHHLFLTQAASDTRLKMHIDPSIFASIYEHKIKDVIVIPGATYAETGFGITNLLKLSDPYASTVSVVFQNPYILKKAFPADLSVDVTHNDNYTNFQVKGNGITYAQGKIDHRREQPTEERLDIERILKRCTGKVNREDMYQKLAKLGFSYGDNFATLDYAYSGHDEALVKMEIPQMLRKEMESTFLHPAILDGMLQSAAATSLGIDNEFFPVQLRDVHLYQALEAEMFTFVQSMESTDRYHSFQMKLLSKNGRVLVEVGLFKIKFIGTETCDFMVQTWTRMDEVSIEDDVLNTKIAVFTDSKVCANDDTHIIISMDKLTTDWIKNELESVLEGVSKVCFLLATIDVSTDNGDAIQEELIKRFLALRLIVLYLTNKQAETPLIIMSEATKAEAATDAASATACLNEAMAAATRCIIREHRTLTIQLVEVVVGASGELITKIKYILSRLHAIPPAKYPEIRLQEDGVYTSLLQVISEEAPKYRISSILDSADALLCSANDSEVIEQSFVQDIDSQQYFENRSIDVTVDSAVLHRPCLYSITANNQNFRDIHMHPILCFEFVGRVASGNGSVQPQLVAFFPLLIKPTVKIPKSCIMNISKFQCYRPGLMIKLYCLWNLSRQVKMERVAILFSPETEAASKVLSHMLQCNGTKSTALITPEDLAVDENCSHGSLIATVTISPDILTTLVSKWSRLNNVITLETISNDRTLQSLRLSKSRPRVYSVRPFDIFAPSAILENVQKLYAWIEKHQKKIPELFMSLTRETCPKIENTPISITEAMQTTCLHLSEDGLDMKVMKTQVNTLFHRCGSYIVVGGLTGLGWECVSFLANGGAGCIVILSRRESPSDEKQEEIQLLEQTFGCVVTFIQADVCNFKALESALETLKAKFSGYPLRGIFYGPAVIDDSPLIGMTEEKIRKVVSPKVTGVWNIHVLTAHLSLDYFVMHSSVVSALGNAGQSNYGAGNGFMDGLAHLRRRFEQNGQTINWGALHTGILEHSTKYVRDRLREKGFILIEKQDISNCLEQTLMLNKVQMFIVNVDRKEMAKQLTRDKEKVLLLRLHDYLEHFLNEQKDSFCEHLDVKELRSLDTEDRVNFLQSYLRTLVCQKALLEESSFEDEIPLAQQGLDSMYAMEVAGQIHDDTQVEITASDILVNSVSALTSMINERLFSDNGIQERREEYEHVISQTDIQDSIERIVLEEEQQSQNKSGFIYTHVVHLPDVADASYVERFATECVSKHSIARRTFAFYDGDIKREETRSNASFQTVNETNATEIVSKAHDYLDLGTTGPIKFIFLSDRSEMVLLFHRVAFDHNGMKLLVEEFKRYGDAFMHGKSPEDVHANPERNIAEEIQRVLAPQYENLKAFWEKTLPEIPYATLSISPNTHRGGYCSGIVIGTRMDDAINASLRRFTTSRNSTPFDFMISVYQLMVAFIASTNSPSILVPVDLRQYVSSMVGCVGRCTNYIPVIANTPDLGSTTVEMFLSENQKRLEVYKKHGLYLYKNLKDLLSEDSSKHMHTNQFIYEYQTLKEDFNDKEGESNLTFAPDAETYVFVYNKEDNSKYLELHLRSDMFPIPRAKNLKKDDLKHAEFNAFVKLEGLFYILDGSGGPHILTETDVLACGSLNGF
ncbi:mycocerosic acid synthase-like polyketide synthase [Haliotis rubra]|uniref:mycocerosic acid synthase-like polyketide synthase n=1 Tax=Haliotis rubra TaxID=36100 RepID=UPI001EE5BA6D|nr:mycocerosic acid synthase-like polyketide synthase [Haliotis rubra]